MNKDGSMNVFWYDAHFDEYNNDGTVILFGKCYDPKTDKHMSIGI